MVKNPNRNHPIETTKAIHAINELLDSRLDPEQLKSQLLNQLTEIFQAGRVWIIVETLATRLPLRLFCLNRQLREEALPRPKSDNFIYRTVFETGKFLQLTAFEVRQHSQDLFWTDLLPENLLIAPLSRQEDTLGALILGDLTLPFSAADLRLLKNVSGRIATVLERIQLVQELKENHLETVQALILAIEAKDPDIRDHSERVTYLAVQLGRALELSPSDLEQLSFGAILHDIGKIGIPEAILNKPGPLTQEEYRIIQKHTLIGADIVQNIQFLHHIRPLVLSHHEWYNGTGYPERLHREQIPLTVRALTVCDSFDAMVSNRPYRTARTLEECLGELERNAGSQFDPGVVQIFTQMVREDPARFFSNLRFSRPQSNGVFQWEAYKSISR